MVSSTKSRLIYCLKADFKVNTARADAAASLAATGIAERKDKIFKNGVYFLESQQKRAEPLVSFSLFSENFTNFRYNISKFFNSEVAMVPRSLRFWFVTHFVVDFIFAIPLLIAPVWFLTTFGFENPDPFTARLVGAAL